MEFGDSTTKTRLGTEGEDVSSSLETITRLRNLIPKPLLEKVLHLFRTTARRTEILGEKFRRKRRTSTARPRKAAKIKKRHKIVYLRIRKILLCTALRQQRRGVSVEKSPHILHHQRCHIRRRPSTAGKKPSRGSEAAPVRERGRDLVRRAVFELRNAPQKCIQLLTQKQ
jgi:hypothetical protein